MEECTGQGEGGNVGSPSSSTSLCSQHEALQALQGAKEISSHGKTVCQLNSLPIPGEEW